MIRDSLGTQKLGFGSRAVHGGAEPDATTGAVLTSIYQMSTFTPNDIGRHKGYEYSPTDNPIGATLQMTIAASEGQYA